MSLFSHRFFGLYNLDSIFPFSFYLFISLFRSNEKFHSLLVYNLRSRDVPIRVCRELNSHTGNFDYHFIYLFIYLFIHLSISLFIYLFVCLFVRFFFFFLLLLYFFYLLFICFNFDFERFCFVRLSSVNQ